MGSMAYKMKKYEGGTERKRKVPSFSVDDEEFLFTSVPVAVTSWVLESIGFRELIDSSVEWDVTQCDVTPGDAAKAMVMTMSMGPERPAIENVSGQFDHEPLSLYFDSIERKEQLDPDMLARTLTKIHEAGEDRLFMSTSAAMRAFFGVKTRALRSDTTSVSVWGEYDVYDENGYASVIGSDDERAPEAGALYITRGYSKDKRPDLKQYMLGDVVDDNGIQWLSKVLDGNTADPLWNKECLEILRDTLQNDRLVYVADSKVVNDPLITSMLDDGIMFLSRCPANFSDQLLDRTLMSFDLDDLQPIENISPRKKAAKRRITSTDLEYKGKKLRAVLVETSTLAGKGEKAIQKAEQDFINSIDSFDKEYNCRPDAEKALERFRKKHSKGIFDISAEYDHQIVEKRPRGRPRADGTDIRRSDRWTVDISYKIDEQKAEVLRRRKSYLMLITNVPTPEQDPELGLNDEDLVRMYASEWRVEWNFKGKKRPIMVERLFMKDVGRAEALITIVNIAALVRAMVQLLIRRGVDELDDSDLPRLGRWGAKLQRNVTADYFMEACRKCMIRYDPRLNQCRFFNNADD
jgi:transposase